MREIVGELYHVPELSSWCPTWYVQGVVPACGYRTESGCIAIAERLAQTRIATLDHRHFTVVHRRNGPGEADAKHGRPRRGSTRVRPASSRVVMGHRARDVGVAGAQF